MRTIIRNLLNLRSSLDRRIRIAWWGVLAVIVAALLFQPTVRSFIITIWILVNLALFAGAAAWALFHPRTTLIKSRAARWAFWLTLLSFLASYAGLDIIVAAFVSEFPGFIATLIPLFAIGLIPFLFGFYWFVGGVGAALASLACRKYTNIDVALPPRRGVLACWSVAGAGVLSIVVFGALKAPSWIGMSAITGTPFFTILLVRWLVQPGRAPGRWRQHINNALSRRLIWKRKDTTHTLTVDLRGAALGLLSGVIALVLGAINFFAPFQTTTLANYIRVRNAFSSRMQFLDSQDERMRTIGMSPVVILEIDDTLRYEALTKRSECDFQAEAIRKLSQYGVKRIVLPVPLLDTRPEMLPHYAKKGPLPDTAEVERSVRDLGKLVDAMAKAKSVVLALPRTNENPGFRLLVDEKVTTTTQESKKAQASYHERVALLRQAAVGVGIADLRAYGTPSLTSVSTDMGTYPEIPLVLLAAHEGKKLTIERVKRHPNRLKIAGRNLRTVDPETILVAGSEPAGDNDLPRVSYAALMKDEPIFIGQTTSAPNNKRPAELKDRWSRPSLYFRDKIVFLEPISWAPRETPSGVVSRTEVLAGATAALISNHVVEVRDNWKDVVLVLFLPMIIGHVCARRDPFDSALPVVVACFLVIAFSSYMFMDNRIFVDPVLPVFAAVGALILATQFTFAQERAARNRNRDLLQRFVAPQFVEEMLDDPEGKLGLGGRRTDICVIFADIRNFTQFAESHSPEEVVESVNAYMTAMTDSLHAFGGILDKYTGDGLMALFLLSGDPRAGLAQAVNAALSMRDAATRVSAEMVAQGHAPLDVGIGLHYGPAIVGIVGNPIHQVNYTALGETVVISARLQTLAAGGEVVISQAIYDLLSGAFHVQPGEPVHVKGIASMIRPYRVIGAGSPAIPATFTEKQ